MYVHRYPDRRAFLQLLSLKTILRYGPVRRDLKGPNVVADPVFEVHRTIARAAVEAFGGTEQKVYRYWDDNHESHVDLASSTDSPWRGITSYATIGLSDLPIMFEGKELGARVELVGTCATDTTVFANIVATAAFFVINSGWVPRLGAIFPGMVSMYPSASTTMQHLLLVSPWLWTPNPASLHLSDRKVVWLHAVPISEQERQFAIANGTDALEDRFEQEQIDVFDIDRPSVDVAPVR